MSSIGSISSKRLEMPQLPKQGNPDEYAKIYADQNGLSLEEAKADLKSKYGEPDENASAFNGFNLSNTAVNYSDMFDGSFSENDLDFEENQGRGENIFEKFLDFLKGNKGPKEEGDPQRHLKDGNSSPTGPQNPGDFNPVDFEDETDSTSDSKKMQSPDDYAQQYADEHNITLEEAKAELEEKYGKPQER